MSNATLTAALLALTLPAITLAQTPAPTVKGVWEPVNYTEDLRLTDVFFVTPDVGYVGGVANTILKTTDAGASWVAQLGGDPESGGPEVRRLRFLNEQLGWAVLHGGKLLRTTDGETWDEVGQLDPHFVDFEFTSLSNGVHTSGGELFHTSDGGAHWRESAKCIGSAEIEGLNRKFDCDIVRLQFVSSNVGYALGGGLGGVYAATFLRTDDGGATWKHVSTLAGPSGTGGGMFFVDENTGFFNTHYSPKAYRTTDAGRTWSIIPATVLSKRIKFADPEVGWSFADLCVGMGCENAKLHFTVDGGKRWSSRSFPFPTGVTAFSVPRRDVGYAVGDHGMVYRYRLLPAAAAPAPKAIPAFVVPPLDAGVIREIEQLDSRLEKIDAAVEGGTWTEDAALEKEVTQLAPTVENVAGGVEQLGRRHRNVNLAVLGLKLISELTGQGGGLKEAFASLRQAKDAASASAALDALQGQLDAMQTSVAAFKVSR